MRQESVASSLAMLAILYALHRATTLGDCSAEIFEQRRAHERLRMIAANDQESWF